LGRSGTILGSRRPIQQYPVARAVSPALPWSPVRHITWLSHWYFSSEVHLSIPFTFFSVHPLDDFWILTCFHNPRPEFYSIFLLSHFAFLLKYCGHPNPPSRPPGPKISALSVPRWVRAQASAPPCTPPQGLSSGGPHPTPRGGGPAQPGAGSQPAAFF